MPIKKFAGLSLHRRYGSTDFKVHLARTRVKPPVQINQTTLDGALTANQTDMDSLRSAVCSNKTIGAALGKKNVDCKNVVAANISKDGALTVYVN